MKNKDKSSRIKHETEYVAFLKKRVESKSFKANVSQEEFEETMYKYKKAKLTLKLLTGN